MITDAAELNDPAKAEAYVREAVDNLAADIARLEAQTEKEIRAFSERRADDPEAVQRYTRKVREILRRQTEPMRQHREVMIGLIENIDTLRAQQAEIINMRCKEQWR
jgi:hypothetical protein